jgi:phospholipid transport system substrate-binding protein
MSGRMFTCWLLFGCCLFIVCLQPARAGEPLDKVRQTVDDVLDVLADESLKAPEKHQERRDLIRKTILKRFGFEEMARRSLGRHWRNLSPQQQQEFVDLFSDLLERSYINKIESYGGSKEQIRYTKETIDQDGYAVVDSEILSARDLNVDIEYRLLKRNSNWEVYDVVIEGVSLVSNYRTQFNKIILEDSFAALVKKMKLKLEQEKAVTES